MVSYRRRKKEEGRRKKEERRRKKIHAFGITGDSGFANTTEAF